MPVSESEIKKKQKTLSDSSTMFHCFDKNELHLHVKLQNTNCETC